MTPRLVCLAGPAMGQTFVLAAGETTIGRSSDNAITLASPYVSRRHATIVADGGVLLLAADAVEAPSATFAHARESSRVATYSRSVVRRVLGNRVGVIQGSSDAQSPQTLSLQGTYSALCVPLVEPGGVLGA